MAPSANGIATERLSAAGIGEARPPASNEDESGRALNRRVEVRCDGGE
jgi:outer membrane protein OmpA-like peptidoglycan-associated protein